MKRIFKHKSDVNQLKSMANQPSQLHRTLNFRDLIVYGLLFIAPMAPVGIFGVLDAKSHGAVALVYVVATAAMALTAFSYAQMVQAVPQAGSVFAYANAGLGQIAGFIAGWMISLDYLLIPAVAYLFSGIALHALMPSISPWVFTLIAVIVTTTLNLRGVKTAALVGFVILVMEIAVLLIFIIAAMIVLLKHGNTYNWLSPFTGLGIFSFKGVLSAVSVAVLSFLGFDAIAAFAEENTGGSQQVASALLYCLGLAGLLFIVQTYLATLLMHQSIATLATKPANQGLTFYNVVEVGIGHWLKQLVALSKAMGAAFAALAAQAAGGRLLFAMARSQRLPKILSTVDEKSGVPRVALLIAATITLLAAVWAALSPHGLHSLVSVVDIGALTAFLLLHLSVIGWFAIRSPNRFFSWWKHLLIPLIGLAVIVAILATASHIAQLAGLVWLAVGLGVTILYQKKLR
jgi:amino acid transporter